MCAQPVKPKVHTTLRITTPRVRSASVMRRNARNMTTTTNSSAIRPSRMVLSRMWVLKSRASVASPDM